MNVTIIIINATTLSRQQQELKRALISAETVDETLKAFKDMEACFDESDLGMECWMVARKLLREGRAPEEVIRFGKRALKILIGNDINNIPCFGKSSSGIFTDHESRGSSCTVYHKSSLFIAYVLNLLGAACVDLKRYDESLSYLNWANGNLSKLEAADDPCSGDCVLHAIRATQFQLARVKGYTGRFGEAALHMKKILEIKEKMMEEGCIELGEANKNVCAAYGAALNYKEALPFCLKALEIHTKHFGRDSVVVAQTMTCLGGIYNQLGEYEKADEQKQLSMRVLKNTASNSPALLMELGRYEEAIGVLKGKVSRDDIEGDERALAFLSMAEAFIKLGKFADAKKRMRTAQRIFEKKDTIPLSVAVGFQQMSQLYEEINDPETALSFIRRFLAIPDLPQILLSQGSLSVFRLISLSGKEKEEIPYIVDLLEKLKESFGPEQCEVGYGYACLGVAYMNSGQTELGVKFLENAKDIMDATIGPHHINSLSTSHTLSVCYAKTGRYRQAMEIQDKVVEGLKGVEPRKQELLDKAVMHLNKMKGVAQSHTSALPQSEDGEDLSETISKCGISDDGKENQVIVGE